MSSDIEDLYWMPSTAKQASKAIGHAWAEFETCEGAIIVRINSHDAYRISLKYKESGPYLAIDVVRGGTGETMGNCERIANVVQQYGKILEAHNALGDLLQSSRRFALPSQDDHDR